MFVMVLCFNNVCVSTRQVSALSSDGSAASDSSVVTATTYPYPPGLSLERANVSSLSVSWAQQPDSAIER